MNGQIELMIVNGKSAIRQLEKWQVFSVYDSYLIYKSCGGDKTWEEFQTIVRKRNFENNTLDKLIEEPISGREIPNVNETDVIVIPAEIKTDRPESIAFSELRNDRGDDFRASILANRNNYVYTKNYGWVDRGHAGFLGGDMPLRRFYREILLSRVGSTMTFEMDSSVRLKPTNYMIDVNIVKVTIRIIKPINYNQLIAKRIAYTVFKKASYSHEEEQGKFLLGIGEKATGSSFAEEDLPSNIINFYYEVCERSEENIMQHCIPFSKEKSAWIYDRYEFKKNKLFEPVVRYPSGEKPFIFDDIQELCEGEYYEIIDLETPLPRVY